MFLSPRNCDPWLWPRCVLASPTSISAKTDSRYRRRPRPRTAIPTRRGRMFRTVRRTPSGSSSTTYRLDRGVNCGRSDRCPQIFPRLCQFFTACGRGLTVPHMAGNISRTMVMAAGPTRTTKMPGKMNNTSGKISLTAVLAAFSSAIWRRRVRMESLCTRRAWAILEPNLSAWIRMEASERQVVDAAALPQFLQHLAAAASHLQLQVAEPEFFGDDRDTTCAFLPPHGAWPGRGPDRLRRTRPAGPGRRAVRGRSVLCGVLVSHTG